MHKTVTLVIVGTTQHELMSFAVNKTLLNFKVDKIKIFSNKKIECYQDYIFYKLPDNFNLYDYSNFILKDLNSYIDTDYVLIIQYDGFATNGQYFQNDYFKYDFIGSLTSINHPPLLKFITDTRHCDKITKNWYNIGGGFSLRSKKLLEALTDNYIKSSVFNYDTNLYHNCEDIFVAVLYKEYLEKKHGIIYAPAEICLDFNSETLIGYSNCLGFHGWENIPFHLTQSECIEYIQRYDSNLDIKESHRFPKLLGLLQYCGYHEVLDFIESTTHIKQF